jgi:hypothetical protein
MLWSESSANGKKVMTSVVCKAPKKKIRLNLRKKNVTWELDASA